LIVQLTPVTVRPVFVMGRVSKVITYHPTAARTTTTITTTRTMMRAVWDFLGGGAAGVAPYGCCG